MATPPKVSQLLSRHKAKLLRQAHESPKLKRLKRRLNIPQYAAIGLVECLWHLEITQSRRESFGWSSEDIAAFVEWEGDDVELVVALTEAGWLHDEEERGLFVLSDA